VLIRKQIKKTTVFITPQRYVFLEAPMLNQKRMINAVATLAAIVLFFARFLAQKKLSNLES
jgi:hypothetical protein